MKNADKRSPEYRRAAHWGLRHKQAADGMCMDSARPGFGGLPEAFAYPRPVGFAEAEAELARVHVQEQARLLLQAADRLFAREGGAVSLLDALQEPPEPGWQARLAEEARCARADARPLAPALRSLESAAATTPTALDLVRASLHLSDTPRGRLALARGLARQHEFQRARGVLAELARRTGRRALRAPDDTQAEVARATERHLAGDLRGAVRALRLAVRRVSSAARESVALDSTLLSLALATDHERAALGAWRRLRKAALQPDESLLHALRELSARDERSGRPSS